MTSPLPDPAKLDDRKARARALCDAGPIDDSEG